MAIQNSYTVNGALKKKITGGYADIEMSTEDGVKAGCLQRPIPLLNKITVTSMDGVLSSAKTIYAGYKIVEQMLGTLVHSGNYNPSNPYLNTIITSGKFGIFEPAHYNSLTRTWVNYNLSTDDIRSLINLNTGIKICVKIDYTGLSSGTEETVYVAIPGVSTSLWKVTDVDVPYYEQVGSSSLERAESVDSSSVEGAARRSWFESILTRDILNVNLSESIVDPKMTEAITITLMAYIGDLPTANNTFLIRRMNSDSTTSVVVQFETYEPTITIFNADQVNNPDSYDDRYGSVAEYNSDVDVDTTISISIIAPD